MRGATDTIFQDTPNCKVLGIDVKAVGRQEVSHIVAVEALVLLSSMGL
uniref:Uncharacterized protein n=1 Tax=Lepeophtheirus salmonis TaxID=72036 RepID=A0A0K2TXK7_LEPSM